jgi:hypothetical protein
MKAYELMHLLSDERCDCEVRLGGVSGEIIKLTGVVFNNGEGFIEFEVTAEECDIDRPGSLTRPSRPLHRGERNQEEAIA